MVKLGPWNGFNDTYCCPYFLDPTEELFQKIGKLFIEKVGFEMIRTDIASDFNNSMLIMILK